MTHEFHPRFEEHCIVKWLDRWEVRPCVECNRLIEVVPSFYVGGNCLDMAAAEYLECDECAALFHPSYRARLRQLRGAAA